MSKVGIAGATGLVGETLIRVLESAGHEIEELRLFASERSAGTSLTFRDRPCEVRALDPKGFDGLDVAFTCLEAGLSAKLVPKIAKHCPVIDKSNHFRLNPDVPLVVPEVNADTLGKHKNVIANPNCTTIPLCVALAPLAREYGLEALHVATYQSVSGAGRTALEQLAFETEFLALGREPDEGDSPFPGRIAGNLIPQIGAYDKHGHSAEELKLANESRKILGLPGLKVNVTCVRVPVAIGHSLAVTVRCAKPVKPKAARALLQRAPGVTVMPDDEFMTPAECVGDDDVYVSRVRLGANPEELSLWIVTDNLRKGAATNAVQIAELILKEEK
jgi:aspartate-semialdehyde dehydrogenase